MAMRGTTLATAGFLVAVSVMAVGTSLVVKRKLRSNIGNLRAQLAAEVDRGSLAGLGRAQAIGRRVMLDDPDDAEVAATVAFVNALLATEFGQGTSHEA